MEIAIDHTARLAKQAIASRDAHNNLRSLVRLHAFLIGAWAECRLRKLLHEEFGLSEEERSIVLSGDSQLSHWEMAVELAFRKRFNIPKAKLDSQSLGVTNAARLRALLDALGGELRIVIEIRNKLAHGQWIYPFTSDGSAVEPEKYQLLNNENLLSLKTKYAILGYLADSIHDLIVSPKTFDRDFEMHFRKLTQSRTNLLTKSYANYERGLVQRRERVRKKADQNDTAAWPPFPS